MSENNFTPGDERESASDVIFRRLATSLVGKDTAAVEIEHVRSYAQGPELARLLPFSLVIWYTGASYGGNADNSAVLGVNDEKTVRSYLEQKGGTVVLISPGYVSKVLDTYSTWDESSWPFLSEVMGVRGANGLAQRFNPGTVVSATGTEFHVEGGSGVESQFSVVNPDGAAVVYTTQLTTPKPGYAPVPVATAFPYGKGRMIYVGFTFEKLAESELAPAFQTLFAATGLAAQAQPAGTAAKTAPSIELPPSAKTPAVVGGLPPISRPPATGSPLVTGKELSPVVPIAPATPAPKPSSGTTDESGDPAKIEDDVPVLARTSPTVITGALLRIYTGIDSKEAPSEVKMTFYRNGGLNDPIPAGVKDLNPLKLTKLGPEAVVKNQELAANSVYEYAFLTPGPKTSYADGSTVTIETFQQHGVRVEINYTPNFFLDAWRIQKVELVIQFGCQEHWMMTHTYMGTRRVQEGDKNVVTPGFPKTITWINGALLNDGNRQLVLIADGFFMPK
ncbi:hypothetical protein CMV30_11285 [Nibricoccus aquaticus]|uniref:Uncharacterized protein n=2 Tax=Nibricoccus aquaticus TaxID=2576891 RepID=A0A290Q765_9BACT|nr:hypothetical protein CMV30_11285 [Nibricoccus aquaticus]